jgi:ribosomal protein L7/L12
VRVQARATEGVLDSFDEENGSGLVIEDDGTRRSFRMPFCSVEVVEPADDPSKDPEGTYRRNDSGVVVARLDEKDESGVEWVVVFRCGATDRRMYDHREVTGWPVIGAVPGTPAAEANPVPPQVLVRVREMLSNGQKVRAIKAIREVCVGMGLKEAKAYAESLPEWAEGDRALGDQIRDGLNLNPHGWEPRVFQADGPEPPEDVKVLRWLDSNPENRWPYLVHGRSGWTWTTGPDDLPSHLGAYWNDATRASPGRYEEVQP